MTHGGWWQSLRGSATGWSIYIFITKVWYIIEVRQRQWHVNGVEVHCQQRLAWQGQMHKCEIKIFRQLGVNRGTSSVEEIKTKQIDERQH